MSSEISWELILSDNEVKTYLKLEDLIQLSLCSRHIRSKLNGNIFKLFNLTKFFKNTPFHSMFTNEVFDQKLLKVSDNKYLHQMAKQANCQVWELKVFYNPFQKISPFYEKDIDRFRKSLDWYKKFIKALNLRFENDFYHCLREVPFIFPNLTRLALDSSTLPLLLCQSLFDKLELLKSISMKESKLIQFRKNAIKLKFPNSVQKLSLCSCKLAYIRSPKAQIPYFSGRGIQLEWHAYLFSPQFLPNLLTFKYSDKPQSNTVATKFIALNPQLENITIDSKNVSFDLMLALSEKEKVFDLAINSKEYRLSADQISDFPILPNLRQLELEVPLNTLIYNMLPIIVPNIKGLVLHCDRNSKTQAIDFILKFTTLISLKINFNSDRVNFKDLKLAQLPQLEEIDLIDLNLNFEEFKLISFPSLKSIRIEEILKSSSHRPRFNLPNNWKFYKFSNSLKFYKVEES